MFDKKKEGGTVAIMTPAGDAHDDYDEPGDAELLEHIGTELIESIHAKDVKGTVAALHALIACIQQGDEPQDQG